MTARKRLGTQTLASAIRQLTRFRTLGIAVLGVPGVVLAGPTGEDVVHGDVGITRPDPGGTVVDQGSSNAIVNWDSFSVGSDEYVNFIQPSSSAVILNRVIGNNASEILGTVNANGHVFLVNPNGVYFGPGASLDLQGFLATTLDIDNADFLDGNYTFTKPANAPADASVVNDGTITAKDGGYVVLAGDYVENNGVIAAKAGHVALGAGRKVTLDLEGDGLVNFAVDEKSLSSHAGVKNAGDLVADGGTVVMTAKVAEDLVTTAVNNEGLVRARSISESGGEVYLAGTGGNIEHSGTIDADGTGNAAGGTVRVESDKNVNLTSTSRIDAAGAGTGHGGDARVIADHDLYFNEGAEIHAEGGEKTTRAGGFVEVSGHQNILLRGLGRAGSGGTFLVDPVNLTLVNDNPTSDLNLLDIDNVITQLNNGSNFTIDATETINASSGVKDLVATNGSGNLSIVAQSSSAAAPLQIDLRNVSNIDINGSLLVNANQPFTNSTTVQNGTSIQLSDVSAASLTIYGASINTGTLTANTGAIVIGGHTDATGSLLAASTIQTGNVDAAGNVRVLADTSINLGNVTGNAANIVLSNFSTSNGTFTLDVGDVTATGTGTNDNVLISAAAAPVSAGGNNNVRVTTGALSAAGGSVTARASALGTSGAPGSASLSVGGPVNAARDARFDARANGTGTGSITINGKTTSGQRIRVATDGGNIVAGTLSVNNTGGPASIDVVAADLTNGIGGDITINGAVNASGQARSGALGSFGDANLGPADQPLAARVRIDTLQSGSNAIDISNGINVTANAASNYSLAGTNFDTNTLDQQSGSGGVAAVSVSGGSNGTVNLGGLTMTGPDVFADIHGGSVSLGAVSMTGTGHNVSRRQEDLSLGTEIFSSTNSAGFVSLLVDNYGLGASRITGNDVTISGKGIVRTALAGDRVTVGNVSIDAAAVTFDRTGVPRGVAQATTAEQRQLAFGYVPLFDEQRSDPSFDEPDFDEGTVDAGFVRFQVDGGFDPQAGTEIQATSASFGSLALSGTGRVEGRVNAGTITANGNISITANAGTISGGLGTRIFQDTNGNTYDVSDRMDGGFGAARLDLLGGSTGSINLAGTVNLEGPGATADINGGTVQFGDTVTLNGTGGTISVRSDYTNIDNSADTYTTSFEGPFERTGLLVAGNNVAMTAGLTISGPGFAGALIEGGSVDLGSIDITATSTRVTRFDSRVMASPQTADEGAGVLGLSGATVNGDITVDAGVNAHLGINGNIDGVLDVNAGGNIDTTLPPRHANDGPDGTTLTLPAMNTQATGIAYNAGNNIDLSGVSLAAGWMTFEAGGSILNGGVAGTISADAMAMAAAGDIILDATTLDIGNATLGDFGVTAGTGSLIESDGDTDLVAALANNGIAPDHISPNGSFVAGGQVVLSQLSLQGSHLYFKANSVSFLNNWNLANSDTLVQITPFDPNANSFFEATRAQLPAHNNGLQLSADFDLTDIGTLALGDSTDYAGDVFIGQNGDIDLGSTNLVVATTGKISGLDNVVSSGLVDELSALTEGGFQEPSVQEIEGEADDEDKEEGDLGTGGDGGGEDRLISHDTIDESNICT